MNPKAISNVPTALSVIDCVKQIGIDGAKAIAERGALVNVLKQLGADTSDSAISNQDALRQFTEPRPAFSNFRFGQQSVALDHQVAIDVLKGKLYYANETLRWFDARVEARAFGVSSPTTPGDFLQRRYSVHSGLAPGFKFGSTEWDIEVICHQDIIPTGKLNTNYWCQIIDHQNYDKQVRTWTVVASGEEAKNLFATLASIRPEESVAIRSPEEMNRVASSFAAFARHTIGARPLPSTLGGEGVLPTRQA